MATETNPETNLAPERAATTQLEFNSGIHVCMRLGEFELGAHITERRKLTMGELAMFNDNSLDPEDRQVAKDKTVVVTGVEIENNTVHVADLFREGGEILSGQSRPCVLTVEGWIAPQGGLPVEAISSGRLEDYIDGYFSPFDGMKEEDEREATDMLPLSVPKAREAAMRAPMAPGYVELEPAREYYGPTF